MDYYRKNYNATKSNNKQEEFMATYGYQKYIRDHRDNLLANVHPDT